jgi:hypothetical protein
MCLSSLGFEFGIEMEFNIRIITDFHIQEPIVRCKINDIVVFIMHNIGVFEANEIFQFLFVG